MRFKEFNTQQIPTVGRKDFSKLSPKVIRATQDANKIATQKATQDAKSAIVSNPNQTVGQQTSLSQKPIEKQPTSTMPTIPKDIILPTGSLTGNPTGNELGNFKVEPKGNDITLTSVNKKPGEKTISTKISRQEFLSTLAALQGKQNS